MGKRKFYETPEFAAFIRKHVLPGNGSNYYNLLDDGSVSEYTNEQDYCPAESGHIVFRVRRDPEIKTEHGYIGLFRWLDRRDLL